MKKLTKAIFVLSLAREGRDLVAKNAKDAKFPSERIDG